MGRLIFQERLRRLLKGEKLKNNNGDRTQWGLVTNPFSTIYTEFHTNHDKGECTVNIHGNTNKKLKNL